MGMDVDTKTFLKRVHAKSDELVVCCHRPDPSGSVKQGFFWQRGSYKYSEWDKAVKDIKTWDSEKLCTVYFTVGSFSAHEYESKGRTKWYRKAEHAASFKSVCFDLDIGDDKQYSTQKDASIALLQFTKAVGLPFPMLVSSGNGLHAYWPLTAELPRDIWVRMSKAMRSALDDHGLKVDESKVHDPSMVLRPVGTHHKKSEPWKEVIVLRDCEDVDPMELAGILKPWVGAATTTKKKPRRSSVMDAVLSSNDVNLDLVAEHCKQINILVKTGGFSDAAGQRVEEPLWRASLGIAKHCTDPEVAVTRLAGEHPDFDLAYNLEKMEGWGDHGPTTCETFERLCPQGCAGCPHKGTVKSPARLCSTKEVTVKNEEGKEEVIELPEGYVIRDNCIYKEVKEQVEGTDDAGNDIVVEQIGWKFVSSYLMHVLGMYKDMQTGVTTFRLSVKYPMVGWTEEDHEVEVLSPGAGFNKFLHNRQIFDAKKPAEQERLRIFLVDYLSKVQSENPTGMDYHHFGWQEDETFLCGKHVIGDSGANAKRRLKGAAKRFETRVTRRGSREAWVDAMQITTLPEAKFLRMTMLLAVGSVLSRAVGNCTGVVSIYSPDTTTGKTLALFAVNSLLGHPKELMLQNRDTHNAVFGIKGVLNQMPCTIDEMTRTDPNMVVSLVYDLSSGVEKNSMTQTRELRDPARWTGPTFITTNTPFYQQFDQAQSNDSALKARCIELVHEDRTFVTKGADGRSPADEFVDKIIDNHGWAYPELVSAVIQLGGDKKLWTTLRPKFIERFGPVFRAVDKYAEPMIITGWIMGTIAKKQGLIPFDVDETVRDWIAHINEMHRYEEKHRVDAIDVIGQFLQEHNDQIIHVTQTDGDSKETVKMPPPEKAVAREKIRFDVNKNIKAGSYVAINVSAFKKWLAKTRDGIDRVSRELNTMGALIKERERVTLFKGCPGKNPGQAYCLMVDLTHDRFLEGLDGADAVKNSSVLQSILAGEQ